MTLMNNLPTKRQLGASILSLLLLSLALFTLWLSHQLPSLKKDTLTVRKIDLAASTPPPPPPPSPAQTEQETAISLQVPGAGAPLPVINIKPQLKTVQPPRPTITAKPILWQSLEIDWQAFALNDLDGLPKLLSPLRVNFPKSLSRRGIDHVLVKLDIVIDQQGQVSLVDIIENPHPELLGAIQQLVRNTRFSAPQKDQQPVRARFIWPVEIQS